MDHRPPPLEGAVFAALDRLTAGASGPLCLAVSGGGDSMALLHLAARWGRARARAVTAASVDHGLRAAARGESAAAAWQARALDLPHQTLSATVAAGNLQAAAREARLGVLARWAAGAGASHLALAHTLDDQAETVLLRLARGSTGAEGLAAMRPARPLAVSDQPDASALTLIRPLLGLGREALRQWLRDQGVGWIEEPSNADPRFDRVRARAALTALGPLGLTPERLAATAERAAAEASVLRGAAAVLAASALSRGIAGEIRLDAAALTAALPETALRVVAWAATALTGAAYPPRREALARALDMARRILGGEAPGAAALADGVLLAEAPRDHADPPALALLRELAAVAASVPAIAGAEWDARLRLDAAGPPGAWLGAAGAAAPLERGAAARWRQSPRAARLSAPALLDPAGQVLALHAGRAGWIAASAGPLPVLPAATDLVHSRLQQACGGA